MIEDTAEAIIKIGFFGLFISLWLTVAILPTWLAASLITSGVKTLNEDCGTTYKIEKVLGGDWFCPEDK